MGKKIVLTAIVGAVILFWGASLFAVADYGLPWDSWWDKWAAGSVLQPPPVSVQLTCFLAGVIFGLGIAAFVLTKKKWQ